MSDEGDGDGLETTPEVREALERENAQLQERFQHSNTAQIEKLAATYQEIHAMGTMVAEKIEEGKEVLEKMQDQGEEVKSVLEESTKSLTDAVDDSNFQKYVFLLFVSLSVIVLILDRAWFMALLVGAASGAFYSFFGQIDL